MTVTDPPAPAAIPERAPAGAGPDPGRRPPRRMAPRFTSGRLVPMVTAVGVVVAAGVAFGRVFGFAALFGPLIMATMVGLTGGLVARRALTEPASGESSGPGGSGDDPVPATEPGPAWLAARPAPGPRPRLGAAQDIRRPLTAAVAVALTTLAAPIVVDALAARPAVGGVTTAITRGVGGIFGGWSKIVTTSVPVPPTADRLPVLAGVIAWPLLSPPSPPARPVPG